STLCFCLGRALQLTLEDSQVTRDRVARVEEYVPEGGGQLLAGRVSLQVVSVLDQVADRRLQPPTCTLELRGGAHPARRLLVVPGSGERLRESGPEGAEVGLALDPIEQRPEPAVEGAERGAGFAGARKSGRRRLCSRRTRARGARRE